MASRSQWVGRIPATLERVTVRLRPQRKPTGRPIDAGKDLTMAQRLENLENHLETRLRHLEAMLEGLQDAVHRGTVRNEREINELQRKAEPAEIRKALDQDARHRGI